MHFEELWEKSEQFHQANSSLDSVDDIIEELTLKIGLYKAINQRAEISEDNKKEAKSRLLGEILLTLTSLSLKDNVNVYEALQITLLQHSITHYSQSTEE
jgi:hypothetical protein